MKEISALYRTKVLWIFLLFISLNKVGLPQTDQTVLKNSACYSYVVIAGETNVNQFELKWYDSHKAILKVEEKENQYDTTSFRIKIPVKDFKADNSLLYNDFMELMKANEFPKIVIRISQDQIDKIKTGNDFSTPDILLTIAGVSNLYKIPCHAYKCSEKTLFVKGTKKILLTDFNMNPPVKLEGLIKVRDEIEVQFGFILKFIEPIQIVSL